MPSPDVPDRRNVLQRLVLITVVAMVVAGIVVPATTKVGLPTEVAQPTTTTPSVTGPEPAVSRPADAVKTTRSHPTPAPPQPVSPALPRTRTAAVKPRQAAPPSSPAAPASPPAAQGGAVRSVGATPNGGYVLPDGHFRVTGDARTILDFEVRSRCAGSIALPSIPVDATGVFGFDGHPRGAPAGTTVRVAGRFVTSREARGTTRISRGGCHGKTVSFVAHLS